MTNPPAHIRRFEDADTKLVRFIIGKIALEPLAVANHRGYVHPIVLSVWVALSMAMVQYMKWWPNQDHGILRYLSPLPALAAMAVPVMFFVDWFNRSEFEDRAQEILRRRDAFDFTNYYSNEPGSGIWIIEFGKNFVGLIAVDAKDSDQKDKKSRASEAIIRHFYVDDPFRGTGIQDDLLAHAISHAFKTPSIKTIKAEGNPLVPYVLRALRSAGFVRGGNTKSLGLFRWQMLLPNFLTAMALLREYANGPPRSHRPLLLVQSSVAQSGVPLLRHIIAESDKVQFSAQSLVFCLLNRPSDLVKKNTSSDRTIFYDWLDYVPGYTETPYNARERILQAIREAPSGKLNVIIDSVDTLIQDGASPAEIFTFVRTLLSLLRERPHPARLVLHVYQSNELIALLAQASLSPALVYLTAHPPALLTHLAKEYLTPPPPSSTEIKFWSAFLPMRDRPDESISLVHGSKGEGSGNTTEMVVEILVRSGGGGRKRDIPRALEGWSITRGEPCELASLESLKGIWRKAVVEAVPDPTQNISFNLKLTASQQESKAQVPLPYTLDGKASQLPKAAAILYDPDSADDIDDDDPDEDLDI
ncbi:hypothetical protein APHAL10511_006340 [Amanita phalloides]|nr:hypothetical protein APHAL10511_006340 [Amanita phalloides]